MLVGSCLMMSWTLGWRRSAKVTGKIVATGSKNCRMQRRGMRLMTHPFESEMKVLIQTISSVARKVDYSNPISVKAGSEVVQSLTLARKQLERMVAPDASEPTHFAMVYDTVVARVKGESA